MKVIVLCCLVLSAIAFQIGEKPEATTEKAKTTSPMQETFHRVSEKIIKKIQDNLKGEKVSMVGDPDACMEQYCPNEILWCGFDFGCPMAMAICGSQCPPTDGSCMQACAGMQGNTNFKNLVNCAVSHNCFA